MPAPDWTKDERALEDAKDYLRQGNTIDFYEQIASALLREHPTDPIQYCIAIVADLKAGKQIKAEGEFQPKKEEDNKYMRQYGISELLDKWVLALLDARPPNDADRLQFHENYLKKLQSERA